MKKFIMIFLFSSFIFACNTFNNKGYTIQGQLKGIHYGKIYLQKFRNKIFETVDSSELKAGKFYFSGSIKDPELYAILLEGTEKPAAFFLENANIVMSLDTSDVRSLIVKGSVSNDLYTSYKKTSKEKFDIHQFITKNPGSTVAAYVLYRDYSYRLSTADLEKYTNIFSENIRETSYISVLYDLIALLKKVEIGAQAPDFTLPDTSGEMISLSSIHGKLILIDFWASWCPYCREENPNVVKTYQKYRNEGLHIIGVSLDKKKESWMNAIDKDKLDWINVSSLTKWDNIAVRMYGIRGIPANVLIDHSGRIIAKNLFGNQLFSAVDSILKK